MLGTRKRIFEGGQQMNNFNAELTITVSGRVLHLMLDRLENELMPFEGNIKRVKKGIWKISIKTNHTHLDYFRKHLTTDL